MPVPETTETDFDPAAFAQSFDHHAVEFSQHMNDIFRHMRAHSPVARTDAYGGFWVLTRYADIVRAARDDETFSLAAGMSIPSNRQPGDPPFVLPGDLDPPRSFVYRRLLEPLVAPAALVALEPEIRRIARALIDEFIEAGEADLVHDLAAPLTAIVTLRLTGLPEADWPQHVAERRHTASVRRDPEEDMRRVNDRFTWTLQSFREQIARQRTEPVPGGLIARLLEARIDDRPLDDAEMIAILINFVSGGLETTQALLGSAWVHLGRNPTDRDEVRDHPELMRGAIEEMLRYFAPQPGLARIATADAEFRGVPVATGEKIFMCWAAANRDESVFDRPDEFDIRRKPNRHLTFGIGAHHCVGANLTRLEARICMEEVLARLPDYRLVEEGLVLTPDASSLFGYLSVPVVFPPAARSAG
jgi:cytochrome P450